MASVQLRGRRNTSAGQCYPSASRQIHLWYQCQTHTSPRFEVITFTHLCIHAVRPLTTVLHQPFMADDWKTKPIKKQASNHPPEKLAGSVPRFGCLLRTVPLSFNLFFCSVFQLLCTCNTFHHLTLSIFLQFEDSSLQLHKYISVQSALSVKAGVLKRSAGSVPVIKGQTSTEWILPTRLCWQDHSKPSNCVDCGWKTIQAEEDQAQATQNPVAVWWLPRLLTTTNHD